MALCRIALAGALTAPLLLSWDIDKHNTFHNAYLMIAAANFAVAFTPLLASSPQHDPGAGPEARALARQKRRESVEERVDMGDDDVISRRKEEAEIDDDTQVCEDVLVPAYTVAIMSK